MNFSSTIPYPPSFKSDTNNIFEKHSKLQAPTKFEDFLHWDQIKNFSWLSVKFPELNRFFKCQVTYKIPTEKVLQLTFSDTDKFFFGFLQNKHEKTLKYPTDFTMIKSSKNQKTDIQMK